MNGAEIDYDCEHRIAEHEHENRSFRPLRLRLLVLQQRLRQSKSVRLRSFLAQQSDPPGPASLDDSSLNPDSHTDFDHPGAELQHDKSRGRPVNPDARVLETVPMTMSRE